MSGIVRGLPIQGWMDEGCLRWLAEQAATHERIAEIGAWLGRSTMVLADNTPGTVYAIDHWNGCEETRHMDWSDPDWVAKQFHANLREHIESGKVKPFRMASVDFAAQWMALGRPPFDMTFIDASHDYASVKADILAWRPLTKGLLCGHDAGHPPIIQALDELLPGYQSTGTIWSVNI